MGFILEVDVQGKIGSRSRYGVYSVPCFGRERGIDRVHSYACYYAIVPPDRSSVCVGTTVGCSPKSRTAVSGEVKCSKSGTHALQHDFTQLHAYHAAELRAGVQTRGETGFSGGSKGALYFPHVQVLHSGTAGAATLDYMVNRH